MQLKELSECRTTLAFEQALSALPIKLADMYSRILRRIPKRHQRETIQLLQVLSFSEHHVSLEEALEIVAVNPQKSPYLSIQDWQESGDIESICPNLVVVTPSVVRLAHASVKDYLLSEEVYADFKDDFVPHKAQSAIVKICLAYLSSVADEWFKPKRSEILATKEMHTWDRTTANRHASSINERFPFAMSSIGLFTQFTENKEIEKAVLDELHQFFLAENSVKLFGIFKSFSSETLERSDTSPLLVLLANLLQTFDKLVATKAESGRTIDLGTSLFMANMNDQRDIANSLIQRGASLEHFEDVTFLLIPIFLKKPDRLRGLLEGGANPSLGLGLPLICAFRWNLISMARLLLEAGACPDGCVDPSKGAHGRPLRFACKKGDLNAVSTLLEFKANPNIKGNDSRSEFGEDEQTGFSREELVENEQYSDEVHVDPYELPLDMAIKHGNLRLIELLRSHGARTFEEMESIRTVHLMWLWCRV